MSNAQARGPARIGVDHVAWEAELEPGDAVRVRWGYGLGFRVSGRAQVIRMNPKSVRVRLTEQVASPYSGITSEGWRAGTELRVPRAIALDWHQDHCIEPLDP